MRSSTSRGRNTMQTRARRACTGRPATPEGSSSTRSTTHHFCAGSWRNPSGFISATTRPKGPRQLTYDGSGPSPRVKHYLGGEPIYLLRGCFVARELAWEVVQEFLRTQQPSPVVKWITTFEFEALGSMTTSRNKRSKVAGTSAPFTYRWPGLICNCFSSQSSSAGWSGGLNGLL